METHPRKQKVLLSPKVYVSSRPPNKQILAWTSLVSWKFSQSRQIYESLSDKHLPWLNDNSAWFPMCMRNITNLFLALSVYGLFCLPKSILILSLALEQIKYLFFEHYVFKPCCQFRTCSTVYLGRFIFIFYFFYSLKWNVFVVGLSLW